MEPSAEANVVLRDRVRHREVVADVGQQALETDGIDRPESTVPFALSTVREGFDD